MSTYNKSQHLDRVLKSIVCQNPPFEWEVIVADDGSDSNENREVCARYPKVTYIRINRPPGYRNPSLARNVAYRAASGEVLICQSDDVEHKGNVIEPLVRTLKPKTFVLATVLETDWEGKPATGRYHEYSGPNNKRPFFFLGSLYRRDLYAIGGNEEAFVAPGWDDNFFGDCLQNGLKLKAYYAPNIKGWHLAHPRPAGLMGELGRPSRELYNLKAREAAAGRAAWAASGAPWPTLPKRMSFFWTGCMSWMRYLTLQSFRKYHPDWEIRLYTPVLDGSSQQWSTQESADITYSGLDYGTRLDALDIRQYVWRCPVRQTAAAQACDLFEWEMLGTIGGFYADMDILWLQSIEPLRKSVGATDALFCPEKTSLAIGFFAAVPNCRLFQDVYREAKQAGQLTNYQGYGVDTFYRLTGVRGLQVIPRLRNMYSDLELKDVACTTVYPFDWQEIHHIFERKLIVSKDTYGIHWFGGSQIAQDWLNELTPQNCARYENTFTHYALPFAEGNS